MDSLICHTLPEGQTPKHLIANRFNGWTRPMACRFLEWSGWYNYSIALRLLGHYRLFKNFKAAYSKTHRDSHVAQVYIHQYKAHGFKYFISRIVAVIYSFGAWRGYYSMGKLATINRRLVDDRAPILHEFLTSAHVDFGVALNKAVQQINSPAFFNNADR